jgi:hypothetical protein
MPTHDYNVDPYYKIIVPNTPSRKNPTMIIVCIQDFDEYDYYSDEWLRDDDGVVSFNSREDAREYLADKVHTKWISAEDKMTPTSTHVDRYRLP